MQLQRRSFYRKDNEYIIPPCMSPNSVLDPFEDAHSVHNNANILN